MPISECQVCGRSGGKCVPNLMDGGQRPLFCHQALREGIAGLIEPMAKGLRNGAGVAVLDIANKLTESTIDALTYYMLAKMNEAQQLGERNREAAKVDEPVVKVDFGAFDWTAHRNDDGSIDLFSAWAALPESARMSGDSLTLVQRASAHFSAVTKLQPIVSRQVAASIIMAFELANASA